MENLIMLQSRTGSFTGDSLPCSGVFCTSGVKSLEAKVSADGRLLPFAGNTTVFLLDEEQRRFVQQLQDELHENCADMLAVQRLSPDTFHMTLHDLENGPPGQETNACINNTRPQALEILQQLRRSHAAPVLMRPTYVYSMVATSLVLGLEPADDENCLRLMKMYESLHPVVMPGYPYLTPHITLAYYRPGLFSEEQLLRLRAVLDAINIHERRRMDGAYDPRTQFILDTRRLVYQEFSDMNHYVTIEAERRGM